MNTQRGGERGGGERGRGGKGERRREKEDVHMLNAPTPHL